MSRVGADYCEKDCDARRGAMPRARLLAIKMLSGQGDDEQVAVLP